MNTIVFIPSKTSSKRIPSKNIRPFADSSLLQVTFDFFRKFTDFEVVVSSDDQSLSEFAASNNCNFHLRQSHICQESTTNFEVLQDWITSHNIYDSRIILAQPSHPIRYKADLDLINRLPFESDYVSVVKSQAKYINSLDRPISHQRPSLYRIDGSYYVISPNKFRLEQKPTFYPFLIPFPDKRIDVDFIDQFHIAELLYKSEHL